jgi:hypothetical protein
MMNGIRDTRRPAFVLGAGLALAGLLLTLSCVRGAPLSDPSLSHHRANGYRALFRGEATGPEGKRRFKMAVALVPPDRLRLEFFGPIGGPRLVVAVNADRVLALFPRDRIWDGGEASAAWMDRLVGVPLAPSDLVALLTARPMCPQGLEEQHVQTKPAVTFGRTLTWYDVTCPPDEIRYRARCKERGGLLDVATVREGLSGAMILEVEYGDHIQNSGPRWPKEIRIHVAQRQTMVALEALEGPTINHVQDSVFAPAVPESFARRPIPISLIAPGLLGSTASGEK